MQDRYETFTAGLESPISHGFTIAPDDSGNLPEVTRAIYVGSAGSLSVVLASGASVIFTGVVAGTLLPVRVTRVHATATTAGGIVGLA